MTKNTILLLAGITTMVQACIQFVLTTLAMLQYFCVIDLLRELPLLLYIRILYFHNPTTCDTRISIGQSIVGMADQAFVLVTSESLPTFRTFIVNAVYCGLSVVWIATSGVLIHGGARNNRSAHIRWPWMAVMVIIFGVDLSATVTFITDTFRTRTLADLVDFVGGVLSGAGSQTVDTSLAAWVMTMIYSRFVVTIVFNVFLVICVLVDCGDRYNRFDDEDAARIQHVEEGVAQNGIGTKIPRATLINRIPTWLSSKPILNSRLSRLTRMRGSSSPDILADTPDSRRRSPARAADPDKHRVNFPPNLLSLPQRLENLMAEQQRRLDSAVIDTAGRCSPQASNLSNIDGPATATGNVDAKGRRGTAAELQGQLPWSYISATPHRMRDQLPPDEELPPVPVPDYTLHPKYRKASVHRAGSNVSQPRHNATPSPLPRHLVLPF